jgi:hypothetical protein
VIALLIVKLALPFPILGVLIELVAVRVLQLIVPLLSNELQLIELVLLIALLTVMLLLPFPILGAVIAPQDKLLVPAEIELLIVRLLLPFPMLGVLTDPVAVSVLQLIVPLQVIDAQLIPPESDMGLLFVMLLLPFPILGVLTLFVAVRVPQESVVTPDTLLLFKFKVLLLRSSVFPIRNSSLELVEFTPQ